MNGHVLLGCHSCFANGFLDSNAHSPRLFVLLRHCHSPPPRRSLSLSLPLTRVPVAVGDFLAEKNCFTGLSVGERGRWQRNKFSGIWRRDGLTSTGLAEALRRLCQSSGCLVEYAIASCRQLLRWQIDFCDRCGGGIGWQISLPVFYLESFRVCSEK